MLPNTGAAEQLQRLNEGTANRVNAIWSRSKKAEFHGHVAAVPSERELVFGSWMHEVNMSQDCIKYASGPIRPPQIEPE